MLEVRIGNVVFYGDMPPRGEGHLIDPEGFGSGWTSGTDVRRDETAMPQAHGSFDVPGFLSSRVVSISGVTLANSPERLKLLGLQLTGLLADGGRDRIQVKQAGSTEWAPCRLAGKTQFQVNGATETDATFQIQVWCPSPLRFGETRHFGAGELAYHYGNFAAAPFITVSGSMPSGYTINGPGGKKFTVTAAVSATDVHKIDMATGILRIDDVPVYGVVSRGDTWAVPPGRSVGVTLSPVSGSGSLDVAVTDTYV